MAPPSISPSRAQDFQQCPLLYRFRVVDKLPEPPSSAATKGTLVHSVLERMFDAPPRRRTVDNVLADLEPAWIELKNKTPQSADLFSSSEEENQWLAEARELLRTYFTLEDPVHLAPADRELFVTITLPGDLRLRGFIDRVDVAPASGAIRVVDYKTGKAPGERFQAKALFQLRCYGLALWRLRGVMPAMLQLEYLGNGQIIRDEPTEAQLEATERKLLALWQAIEHTARENAWTPSTSRLCDWCSFQSLCPAFGGTPPPIPTDALERLGITSGE